MQHQPIGQGNRREFFRAGARYLLLAGLSAAGVMAARRGNAEKCVSAGICRGCGVFNQCGLPQALSVRQALQRKAVT